MSEHTPGSGPASAGQAPSPSSEAGGAVAAAQSLNEDLKVVYWILVTSAAEGVVRVVEAETVIRSLWATLNAYPEPVLPLLDIPQAEVYTAAHAINVALTTMAVAQHLGYAEREARALGEAALLKDIGHARLPAALLGKTTPLGPEELDRVREHPVIGARMLIETTEPLELAAVVAYEHHLGPDGRGYPTMAHPRPAHFASRLIRIVDAFCALVVRRPQRDAWSFDDALAHVSERAGIDFDRDLSARFADALRRLQPRIARLTTPEQPLPWASN